MATASPRVSADRVCAAGGGWPVAGRAWLCAGAPDTTAAFVAQTQSVEGTLVCRPSAHTGGAAILFYPYV